MLVRHQVARARVLAALMDEDGADISLITDKLHTSAAVITALEKLGLVRVVSDESYRKPDLYDRTMEFRRDNYFLQHAPEHEDVYDRVAELRAKNAELLDTPEVYDFLMTEWTYFHMMQTLFDRLMTEINF